MSDPITLTINAPEGTVTRIESLVIPRQGEVIDTPLGYVRVGTVIYRTFQEGDKTYLDPTVATLYVTWDLPTYPNGPKEEADEVHE